MRLCLWEGMGKHPKTLADAPGGLWGDGGSPSPEGWPAQATVRPCPAGGVPVLLGWASGCWLQAGSRCCGAILMLPPAPFPRRPAQRPLPEAMTCPCRGPAWLKTEEGRWPGCQLWGCPPLSVS